MMYPAARVEARIRELEATIARLQVELATAQRHLVPPPGPLAAADDETEAPAPPPESPGEVVDHFLDALHGSGSPEPDPPDGHTGNFR